MADEHTKLCERLRGYSERMQRRMPQHSAIMARAIMVIESLTADLRACHEREDALLEEFEELDTECQALGHRLRPTPATSAIHYAARARRGKET